MFTTVPMIQLRREVDRLFDETLGAVPGAPTADGGSRPTWAPAADVREHDDQFVLELEIPGVSPDSLEITAERGMLTIAGERPARARDGERMHLRERLHGRFMRSFRLPKGFDENAIEAEVEHGLLRVRLPKAALPQPRRITVQVRDGVASRAEAPSQAPGA